jgi:Cu/Ag efflux pump CusA
VARANVEPTPQEATFEVQVDLDRAQALGIKPGDVRRAAASLLGGITVGNLFEEQKVFDVVVWGAPEIRETQADVQQLLIDTPDGRRIRLGDVAEVQRVENAAVIRHESAARYVDVTADVSGRDVADVTTEVNTVLEDIAFPLDHHAEVLGGFADRQGDRTRLMTVALAAALAIFLLLQAAFRSWRLAAIAFVVLPVTLAGGVVATLLFGGTITLGSIAGLIAVLGIATRGVVLLIRHLQHLERREGMAFGPELVVRATGDRVAPTLMSTLALVAMLVPIVFLGARSGFEVLQPAVITILGGVVTATVVNLFVVPLIYLRFGSVSDPDSWADDLMETVPDTQPVPG